MRSQVWWYVCRSTGIVAWALVTASVLSGLLLSNRLMRRPGAAAWTVDLHRFLAGLAVVFTALHLIGLVADSYVDFGWADVLVPLAADWRPGAVALGVVGSYLLAAVYVTSVAMRHLPRRLWRWTHVTSYALFWSTTVHGALAGTDTHTLVFRWVSNTAVLTVLVFTLVRAMGREDVGGRVNRRAPLP